MPAEPTQKNHPRPAPYGHRTKEHGGAPATSARSNQGKRRENLTLNDWMTVFAYVDAHPDLGQSVIVNHFRTLDEGALFFDQSTLSRRLKSRPTLAKRCLEYANALSSKRVRVVTRPDVERALVTWVKQMEAKNQSVTGQMLREKRRRFEDLFDVPEDERLQGEGWVPSFCKAHMQRERRQHGEAESVDAAAVEAEIVRVQNILARFRAQDMWNIDETSLLPFARPDRRLVTKQIGGKKKEKVRLTVAFACNADGSERLPPFFIGRYAKLRCFGDKTPQEKGIHYRNDRKARLTSELFEEWIKELDLQMQHTNRHICLFIDNFSGHDIGYRPRNIQIEKLAANSTSHVQPLDAGIFRCFKALYRKAFCHRAIELDEAGDRDIYEINLLEAMMMAKEAWLAVEPSTIQYCWDHTITKTGNVPSSAVPITSNDANVDHTAWTTIRKLESITLPEVEAHLQDHLGDHVDEDQLLSALKAVVNAERKICAAIDAIEDLQGCTSSPPSTVKIPVEKGPTTPPQLQALENELMDAVADLQKRRRIMGKLPLLDELLDPPRETEREESKFLFEKDEEIVEKVRHQMAVEKGEIVEGESESDMEDHVEEDEPKMSITDIMKLCRQLEKVCIAKIGDTECALDLLRELRLFRGHIRGAEPVTEKQTTLDRFFSGT